MGRVTCLVRGCTSKVGDGIGMFKLPLNDDERVKTWLLACNRDDLLQKSIHELCYFKVCENHFEKKFVIKGTSRHHLFEEAVPTLFRGFKRKCNTDKVILPGIAKMPIQKKTAVPIVNSSSTDTNNSDALGEVIKEVTESRLYDYPSDKPNILRRSKPRSKISKSISRRANWKKMHIQGIKAQNSNIEVEYVDVNMEPEESTIESVYEPVTIKLENTSDDLIRLELQESKYNDLYKENKFLKHLLSKRGISSDIEFNGDHRIDTEFSHLIDLTDLHSICRICLQKSDSLIPLNGDMTFDNKNVFKMTVLEALQSILGVIVEISDNFPRQICTQCQNHLKLFITFKHTFDKATSILHIFASGSLVSNDKQSAPTSTSEDHEYSKQNSSGCCKVELEQHENDTNTGDVNIVHENSEDLPKLPLNTKRKISKIKTKKQKLHTCPICWTKISMSKFIPHVKSHNTLEKYLNIPIMSPKTRFYASSRDCEGLLSGDGEKLHKCPICKYEFKATEFILHVHHHLTHDQFKCEKCLRTFKKKSYLLSHMLIHSKNFPFRCEKCNKGFVIKSNYECHLLTHEDGELPHKCVECGKGFSNPKHLTRHMTIHTENRTYSTKYRYKRCKYCGDSFSQKEQLVQHVCNQYGVYKCKYCYKVFLTTRMRKIHMHNVHFKENKPGYCPVCNLTYKNIIYHKASKHPKEKLKALCTVCGLYVANIYIHMMKHRNGPIPKSHQCKICSKLFSYRTTLKKHLAIHSGVKPYICSYCGKAFNCRYNLQVHERIHVGDRCHVCPICEKGFLEKSYLNKHMKTHKDIDLVMSDVDYENYSNMKLEL